LVHIGLFAAIVVIATVAIPIPLPGSGYGNPGDGMVILCGTLLGSFRGGLAAGLGSLLADLLLGSAAYAPATFVIKGMMAVCAGYLFKRLRRLKMRVVTTTAMVALCSEGIMVVGYYLYELLLFDGVIASLNLIGNSLQAVVGIVVTLVFLPPLWRNKRIRNLLGLPGDGV